MFSYAPGLYRCKKCGAVFEIQEADIERRPELIGCAPCADTKGVLDKLMKVKH